MDTVRTGQHMGAEEILVFARIAVRVGVVISIVALAVVASEAVADAEAEEAVTVPLLVVVASAEHCESGHSASQPGKQNHNYS